MFGCTGEKEEKLFSCSNATDSTAFGTHDREREREREESKKKSKELIRVYHLRHSQFSHKKKKKTTEIQDSEIQAHDLLHNRRIMQPPIKPCWDIKIPNLTWRRH